MRRAVWLPNWIGDAVMTTPALQALRKSDPQGDLVGIYREPMDAVFEGSRFLTEMILDRSDKKSTWSDRRAFIKRLRQEEFDEIILFTNSIRTAYISWRANIPIRVGFRRDWRGWMLTDKLEPLSLTEPNPVIDEYNRLASHALAKELDVSRQYRLSLKTTRDDETLWEDFASLNCLDVGHYICFNSGGAFGAAKHWPVASFAKLALRIVKEQEVPVVMICGPAERETAREFMKLTNHPMIHSLAEESPSIGFSKAMVKHAGWMISTDSGPRHFAHAFDVPVFTIYGPTNIAWSDTFFEKAEATQLDLECGPCQQRTCPLKHHRCMKDLGVDQVYREFAAFQQRVLAIPEKDHYAA
ncbi:lipopolysaccharide heptosyltransferase II [uncultured Rubinisphaera sp.]|uniref:lipopolysaccharide heptosyltransferase II n=1 Tax=uncultured Rubinisphaera sp. TaxID=1678686 RepID=UPI0030DB1FB6|tara:strand:+ start:85 stop:1152 length:1068 start_codon:yes stop_codon:yes gene_type:complete